MADRGAPFGNNNGSKNKIWSEALQKELTGNKNAIKLRKLARVLIKEAEDGNITAMKELGDRLEGKPAQTIQGPDGVSPISLTVKYVNPTPTET